ncbi:MAG: hypothetical protein IJM57_10845 [Lachnospiraceae bacterium]|nr:hypothetical protein [Lachnospiraceae bacterium]
MNRKRMIFTLIGLLTLFVFALSGCDQGKTNNTSGAPEATPTPPEKPDNVDRWWAETTERGKAFMIFYKDGSAMYDGKNYKSYEVTDTAIRFTSEDGKVTTVLYYDETSKSGELRKNVYRTATYTFVSSALNEKCDGTLIGLWESPENHWSFQFTKSGVFLEDEILPGHYYVNDNGTVRLSYDGHLPESLLYYHVDGNVLTVDYPWPLVELP